jgi:hypothetical protein
MRKSNPSVRHSCDTLSATKFLLIVTKLRIENLYNNYPERVNSVKSGAMTTILRVGTKGILPLISTFSKLLLQYSIKKYLPLMPSNIYKFHENSYNKEHALLKSANVVSGYFLHFHSDVDRIWLKKYL